MAQKILQPAPGLLVRKPDGARLNPDGEAVEMISYWLRRLADGDVAEVEAPAAAAPSTRKSKE